MPRNSGDDMVQRQIDVEKLTSCIDTTRRRSVKDELDCTVIAAQAMHTQHTPYHSHTPYPMKARKRGFEALMSAYGFRTDH
jgi:hypothetical protein